MNKTYLLVPGINTFASSWNDWPNRAGAWINQNTPFKSQPMLYSAGAVGSRFRHSALADTLADMLATYTKAGVPVEIIAHSNGTRVALEALATANWPVVEAIHLVCGAVDGNFTTNGLGEALKYAKIGAVHTYMAKLDRAMKLEDLIVGRWLFGIRTKDKPLGLAGPQGYDQQMYNAGRITEHWWPDYGHSDCWHPENFESTMRLLMGTDA
jgi:pimeloyl-ACP methyl ester carboxylesterase